MDTTDIRLRVLETDVAALRAQSQESKVINAGILDVLKDLRTVTTKLWTEMTGFRTEMTGFRTELNDLRTGQDNLRTEMTELRTEVTGLRTGQDELRAEMRTGHAELREEISVVKRSVGNLELSLTSSPP